MGGDSPSAFSRGSERPVVEGAATEQAKGILSVAFTVSPEEAQLLLEVRARETELEVERLAELVVEHSTQPWGGDVGLVRERLAILLFAQDVRPDERRPRDLPPGGPLSPERRRARRALVAPAFALGQDAGRRLRG